MQIWGVLIGIGGPACVKQNTACVPAGPFQQITEHAGNETYTKHWQYLSPGIASWEVTSTIDLALIGCSCLLVCGWQLLFPKNFSMQLS